MKDKLAEHNLECDLGAYQMKEGAYEKLLSVGKCLTRLARMVTLLTSFPLDLSTVEGLPWFTPALTLDEVAEKKRADLLWAYEAYFLAEVERIMNEEPALTTLQLTTKIEKQWDELGEVEKLVGLPRFPIFAPASSSAQLSKNVWPL